MPIGELWTEAVLAGRRVNKAAALQATLVHAAIIDAIGGGGHLRSIIEELVDE